MRNFFIVETGVSRVLQQNIEYLLYIVVYVAYLEYIINERSKSCTANGACNYFRFPESSTTESDLVSPASRRWRKFERSGAFVAMNAKHGEINFARSFTTAGKTCVRGLPPLSEQDWCSGRANRSFRRYCRRLCRDFPPPLSRDSLRCRKFETETRGATVPAFYRDKRFWYIAMES